MTREANGWVLRGVCVLAIAVGLTLMSRTSMVRGWGGWLFGWMERPLVLLNSEMQAQGEVIFSSRSELAQTLAERERQLVDVARQAAQWEGAERELEEARLLLAYRQTFSGSMQAARVLGHSAPEFPHTIVIDKGATDGIRVEQPVVAQEGILLGTVQEVFAHSARVRLLTHADTRIGGATLGGSGTLGVIEGRFEPLLQMSFVPQESSISTSAVVVSSGADPLIPRNLVIGLVRSVKKDRNTPFLTVLVEPMANTLTATMVGVLTGL